MKTCLAAVVLGAAIAQPAAAITFPELTTIYVGAGVSDDGDGSLSGEATAVLCSNVSGVATSIRLLLLSSTGAVVKSHIFPSVAHGETITATTHETSVFAANVVLLTGSILHGVVNIESLQSAVFCTAAIVDASSVAQGIPLRLIRVNPHPGTVE